jgi:flagellar motility protein MotE (MotC chaperone)
MPATGATAPPVTGGGATAAADPGAPALTPGSLAASLACPPVPDAPTPAAGSDAASTGTDQPASGLQASSVSPGCAADAVATKLDADGHPEPLSGPGGSSLTENTLLQRLAQRRAELDKREADLNLRQAIVEAAEKQMGARADALKALEAQISALSEQKNAMEDSQFAGVVKMYEEMKPQDAASIFDGLDMGVLLRVARAMDPRKMAPILAKMSAARAQQLTAQLAANDPQTASIAPVAAADPNALPQIVGQ